MEMWQDELCDGNSSHSPLKFGFRAKDYRVIWEFNERMGEWTVVLEETELIVD
ncbi:MAG: hypothetical protein PHD13_05895 [Methanocellales archaeon]|nr:hypothetical protein [Methanocellales archaeon]MDD3292029.1 hypothetical protein [Methanocellales archaeon]MDD5235688.1 hypothetical protein [Methanocellales archaeon]MDD5485614.1 hypothetical protein [Methanocellales archaeon]